MIDINPRNIATTTILFKKGLLVPVAVFLIVGGLANMRPILSDKVNDSSDVGVVDERLNVVGGVIGRVGRAAARRGASTLLLPLV